MTKQPSLTTDRLTLRPLADHDVDALVLLAGQPSIARTTASIPHPYHESDARTFIASVQQTWTDGAGVVFAITLAEQNALIGAVGLSCTPQHQRAELGYWVGEPYWNRGYVTEAARAVVTFGFKHFRLRRVTCHHMASNPASGAIMRKLGMQPEGILREHFVRGEQIEDLHCYGLLRHEWEAQRNQATA